MSFSPARFAVRQHVFIHSVVAVVVGAGLWAAWAIPREVFPLFDLEMISIRTTYPGASPEEVEDRVTRPLEDAVWSIEGVQHLSSTCSEGQSLIIAELRSGANLETTRSDIAEAVDRTRNELPDDADDPVVEIRQQREPTVSIALSGDVPEPQIRDITLNLEDALRGLPGVADITRAGIRDRAILINVDPVRAEGLGIPLDAVVAALARANLEAPGGAHRTAKGERLVRAVGMLGPGPDLAARVGNVALRLPPPVTRRGSLSPGADSGGSGSLGGGLRSAATAGLQGGLSSQSGGSAAGGARRGGASVRSAAASSRGGTSPGSDGGLRIRHVAEVSDGFEDERSRVRIDGIQATTLTVWKTEKADAIGLVRQVEDILQRFRSDTSAESQGVHLQLVADRSSVIETRLSTLTRSAILGFGLVLLLLFLVLEARVAMFTALGVPVCILGTLAVMHIFGMTLNVLSMFALIVVLGLLVDDAIVIGESIHKHLEMGKPPGTAAIDGTLEVSSAVTTAVVTTLAAFLPLLLMQGLIGRFLAVIPVVVCIALAISLAESLFALPAHLALLGRARSADEKKSGPRRAAANLLANIRRVYGLALGQCLRYRWITAGISLALVGFALLVSYQVMEKKLIASPYFDRFRVRVTMPVSNGLDESEQTMRAIEAIAVAEIPETARKSIITHVGVSGSGNRTKRGTHLGELAVELTAEEDREKTGIEIVSHLRDVFRGIPGVVNIEFNYTHGPTGGKAVEVNLRGRNPKELALAADQLTDLLASLPGVHPGDSHYRLGKPEVVVQVDDARAAMAGLDTGTVSRLVRTAIDGAEATTVTDGRDEVALRVRYGSRFRDRASALQSLRVITPAGVAIPLLAVADLVERPGTLEIQRRDRQRTLAVWADLDDGVTTESAVTEQVEATVVPGLRQRLPGVTLTWAGQARERREAFESLVPTAGIAILAIFLILGIAFQSYVQPLVVMAAIPYAFTGVILGLFAFGTPLDTTVLVGAIALCGISVNDSILLMDALNRFRSQGVPIGRALMRAGHRRLRPILLTSATTIGGLLPLALGVAGQESTLVPMAVAICWGLVFSTVFTLLAIPALAWTSAEAWGVVVWFFTGSGTLREWLKAHLR